MIDIEDLKPGNEVWVVHNNRPQRLTMDRLEKVITASGVQYNVIDCSFLYGVPADLCFLNELDLIESQVNYWRDIRLNKILKDNA